MMASDLLAQRVTGVMAMDSSPRVMMLTFPAFFGLSLDFQIRADEYNVISLVRRLFTSVDGVKHVAIYVRTQEQTARLMGLLTRPEVNIFNGEKIQEEYARRIESESFKSVTCTSLLDSPGVVRIHSEVQILYFDRQALRERAHVEGMMREFGPLVIDYLKRPDSRCVAYVTYPTHNPEQQAGFRQFMETNIAMLGLYREDPAKYQL